MQDVIKDYLKELASKKGGVLRVCLLGLGSTNASVLRAIRSLDIPITVTVRQNTELSDTPPYGVDLICGAHATDGICEDVVFASPSYRRERLAIPSDTAVTSDTELFFQKRPKKIFAVSGSDGKSTVTTLASLLLFPTFPKLFTGGNLGVPIAEAEMTCDAFVLELSSFNLRYCIPKCERSVLTNITPNHLNWHADFTEYAECKHRLTEHSDEAVLTLTSPLLQEAARRRESFALVCDTLSEGELRKSYATRHTVTKEDGMICIDGRGILPIENVRRRERHHLLNLMSAIGLTIGYTTPERIVEVASEFSGLGHRCEVFTVCGRDYVDSSIDTTPQRTATTLEGLAKEVSIILGGRGKGLPFEPMREMLLRYAKRISVYGEIAHELYEWLSSDARLSLIPIGCFDTLSEAIDFAEDGDGAVLLCPAATSYGEFTSYAQRGSFFREYVLKKHRKI